MSKVLHWFGRSIWRSRLEDLPWWRARPLKVLRVGYLAVRGFLADNCMFRASGLTYITVLSLVPLLAFAFSVAKGFGAYETLRTQVIEPWVDSILPSAESNLGPGFKTSEDSADETAAAEPEEDAVPGADPGADNGSEETAGEATAGAAGGGAEGAEPAVPEGTTGEVPQDTYTTARDAVERVLELVDSTDFNKLGFFGLAILVYTVFKLLGSVERAFNLIWGVRRSRSVIRKLSDYVSLVVITPMLLTTGLGLFTLSQTQSALTRLGLVPDVSELPPGVEPGVPLIVRLAPFLVIVLGLTLVYLTLPNTRVRPLSALWGGLVGGALAILALLGHTRFQLGVANFDAIYAGFAAFPIFLVFVYFLWTTVLLGAEVAAAHQGHGAFRRLALGSARDQHGRERLALRALVRLTLAFRSSKGSCTTEELGEALGAPEADVADIVGRLAADGLVAHVAEHAEDDCWVLARHPDDVRISDVVTVLRNGVEERGIEPADLESREQAELDEGIDRALAGLGDAARRSPSNRSLSELVAELPVERSPEGEGGPAPVEGPDEDRLPGEASA